MLSISVCSLVCLCVLPCRPMSAACPPSSEYVLAELAHGHWMSKLYTCNYRSLLEVLPDRGVQVLCLFDCHECSAGHPIFCEVISIRQLS